jgi:hypothetical protein
MKWWLTVFFLTNGGWIPGATLEGWEPRAYDTEAQCLERKVFAERECRDHPLKFEAVWVCSEGAPASEPPDERPPPVDC